MNPGKSSTYCDAEDSGREGYSSNMLAVIVAVEPMLAASFSAVRELITISVLLMIIEPGPSVWIRWQDSTATDPAKAVCQKDDGDSLGD